MKLGVVVARFQTPDLHPAHHILIGHAMRHSDQLLVALGVAAGGSTNHNPLDFKTRQEMVNHHYPKAMVVPIKDVDTDMQWSRDLDGIISNIIKEGDEVILFCGRDGFKAHYRGKYKANVEQIEAIPDYSGTALRKEARKHPINSFDFRAGVIYGVGNRYPNTYMTVDMAVLRRSDAGQVSVLLARRPGHTHYRFPGGFVDFNDHSLEAAAKRELYEELGIECFSEDSLSYVASIPVDDWRYRGRPDARIMTTLFAINETNTTGEFTPDGDELEEYAWFPLDNRNSELRTSTEMITSEHKPLFMALSRFLDGTVRGVSNPTIIKKAPL